MNSRVTPADVLAQRSDVTFLGAADEERVLFDGDRTAGTFASGDDQLGDHGAADSTHSRPTLDIPTDPHGWRAVEDVDKP